MKRLKYVKSFENFEDYKTKTNEEFLGLFNKDLYFYFDGKNQTKEKQSQREQIVESLKRKIKTKLTDKNTTSEIIKDGNDLIYNKTETVPLKNLGVNKSNGVRDNKTEYGLEIKTYSDDIYENQEQDPIGTYQVVQFSKEGSTGLLVGESTEKVFVIFGVRDNKNFIAQISKEDFDELIRLHIEHTGEL